MVLVGSRKRSYIQIVSSNYLILRILIHPFFFHVLFSLKTIEKVIVSSDLGMTPNNDGDVIRLTLPQLTSERRKVVSLGLDIFELFTITMSGI